MDYGTAIAIAVPSATLIISVAAVIVKSKNNRSVNPLNGVYVRKSECATIVRAFGNSVDNLRKDLIRGIENLDNKFEDLRKALGK